MNADRIREILAANGFVWTEQNRPTLWCFYAREFPWGERVVMWASHIKPFHVDPPRAVEVAFQRKLADGVWGPALDDGNRYRVYDGHHAWPTAEKFYAALEAGAYRSCHQPNDLYAKEKPPSVQLDDRRYDNYATYASVLTAEQSARLTAMRTF